MPSVCRGAAHKLKPILFPTLTLPTLDMVSLSILTPPTFLGYDRAYIIQVIDLGLNTISYLLTRVCAQGVRLRHTKSSLIYNTTQPFHHHTPTHKGVCTGHASRKHKIFSHL